jgi:hypothetical protein
MDWNPNDPNMVCVERLSRLLIYLSLIDANDHDDKLARVSATNVRDNVQCGHHRPSHRIKPTTSSHGAVNAAGIPRRWIQADAVCPPYLKGHLSADFQSKTVV